MAAIREWYSGYSIIYRWFENKFGEDDLYEYWHYIAREVYQELAEKFREGGPTYIVSYFTEIILEDEGKLTVTADKDSVTVEILECPDHIWQTYYDQGYSIPNDNYYKSYEVIYGDVAEMAGYDFEMLKFDTQGRLKFRFSRREESL
jgi:hypothetical protein